MVRFGIIGTSKIASTFIDAAKQIKEFKLVAVYSRNIDTGIAFAKKNGAELVFDSLEEMAECNDIDAVYIASPNFLHCKQSILMMKNSKHVLCEKPVSTNLSELRLMLECAQSNNVVFLEAMRSAYDPGIELVKKNLERLGTLRRFTLDYCQYSSRYDSFKKGEIQNAFNPQLSNAAVMDIGVYGIHFMAMLFGKPTEIKSMSQKLHNGMESLGTILCRYDGMHGEIIYSKITNSVLPSQIQGENGCMLIDQISSPKNIKIHFNDGNIEHLCVENKISNNMYYEIKLFCEAVLTGKSIENNHIYSLVEMEIIDEVRRQNEIVFIDTSKNK